MRSEFATILAALSFMAIAACDAQKREFKEERAGHLYQEAMADYSAGRMEAAVKGFAKALKSNPGNASARFQLACLQQDVVKDYLSAYCNYREYLQQVPDSDKAALAADRMALCRDQAVRELTRQGGAADLAVEAKLTAAVRTAKAAAEAQAKKSALALKRAEDEIRRLTRENEGLRRMVSRIGEDDQSARAKSADARSLLDDDGDEDRLQLSAEAKRLFEEEESVEAPGAFAAGASIVDEAENDGPVLLERRAPGTATKGQRLTDARHGAGDEAAAPPASRPSEYVVRDGDTLYRIAQEFYGRKSAWREIRDANKAVITTDGRVKSGQRIVLP